MLSELRAVYEGRRAEAARHGASAPLATVYALILEELSALDGAAIADRMMGTAEAAMVLAVAPRTAAKWAAEGRFDGAQKTSEGGEWRVPAKSVYAQIGVPKTNRASAIPRLWGGGRD